MIVFPTLSSEQDEYPPKTIAYPDFSYLTNTAPEKSVILLGWNILICGSTYHNYVASLALGYPVILN